VDSRSTCTVQVFSIEDTVVSFACKPECTVRSMADGFPVDPVLIASCMRCSTGYPSSSPAVSDHVHTKMGVVQYTVGLCSFVITVGTSHRSTAGIHIYCTYSRCSSQLPSLLQILHDRHVSCFVWSSIVPAAGRGEGGRACGADVCYRTCCYTWYLWQHHTRCIPTILFPHRSSKG
jgi:hypothetical protein